MWNEPYLETCCRSALHRLVLAGAAGRPDTSSDDGLKDGACLERLMTMGLASRRQDGRIEVSPVGVSRHTNDIAKSVGRPAGPLRPADNRT